MGTALRFEIRDRSSVVSIGSFADQRTPFSGYVSSRIVAELLLRGSAADSTAYRDSAESAAKSLFEAWRSGESNSLDEAFSNLSDSQQQNLRRRFGASLEEFLALSLESDSEMLYSGLLDLGRRLGQSGDNGLAGIVLQTLVESAEWPTVSAALRSEARAEYDAMRGAGPVGRRLEFLARRFIRDVSDPGMLITMGAAGAVFSAVRLGVLSRLAAGPVSWYSQGFAVKAFACSVAFPAEVLSFWGTHRAYLQFTQPESLRWDAPTIGRELGSLALTLGLLKSSGAAVEGLFNRVPGIHALTGEVERLSPLMQFSRHVSRQAGTLVGIAAGNYAEMRLGWRHYDSQAGFWTDSLATLLQFHVGGRLSQEALGPRYAVWMQEMALRTQSVGRPSRLQSRGLGSFPEMVPETAAVQGVGVPSPEGEEPSRAHISAAVSHDFASRGRRRISTSPVSSRPTDAEISLYNANMQHFEQVKKCIQDWNARFAFLQSRLAEPSIRRHGNPQERRAASRLLPSVNLKYLETLRYYYEAEAYARDDKGFMDDRGFKNSTSIFFPNQYARLVDRFTGIDRRLQRYIEKEPVLVQILDGYVSSVEPNARANPFLTWEGLCAQLAYLGRRRYLSRKTVLGLLKWLNSSTLNPAVRATRENVVKGMIDYICKGTHRRETRQQIFSFFDEVIRRGDEGMMESLAVYFQEYHSGIMRDRLQVREKPASQVLPGQTAVEVYDRFLGAILATRRFYLAYPSARGAFVELFYKLERGNKDNNALWAVPILYRSAELLGQGFEVNLPHADLGNPERAMLLARDSDGAEHRVAVTSILNPLSSRSEMEIWLNRAENLFSHGGYGKGPAVLSIQIPYIEETVSKRDIILWARDYLERYPKLTEVHLVIPDRGNRVVDSFQPDLFKTVKVTRSMPTTGNLIKRLQHDVATNPHGVACRLELYRLRDAWARHQMQIGGSRARAMMAQNWLLLRDSAKRFPRDREVRSLLHRVLLAHSDELGRQKGNSLSEGGDGHPDAGNRLDLRERLRLFNEFAEMALELGAPISSRPIDLSGVGFDIHDLHWRYDNRGLNLQADVVPGAGIREGIREDEQARMGKVGEAVETDSGFFSFCLSRDQYTRDLQMYFDNFTLSPHLQRHGAGTQFFAELIRLARQVGADSIISEEISGDHRLTLALYGMKYANQYERQRAIDSFGSFLLTYLQKENVREYNIDNIEHIQAPQNIATARFSGNMQLTFEPAPPGTENERSSMIHMPGRIFLLTEAPTYHGIFSLRDPHSMGTFGAYWRKRFGREMSEPPHN